MLPFSDVNWLAVFVGMVTAMLLGTLWYGPLFGKLWLGLIGKRAEDLVGTPSDYIKTALAAFIGMLALNLIVLGFGANTFLEGALLGAVTYLGLGATTTYVYTTFEGPPESVWLLYGAYQLLVYLIMGGVFALWR